MRLRLLAVTARPPEWARSAADEYLKRLKPLWRLDAQELAPGRRSAGGDAARATQDEGVRLLAEVAPRDYVVTLDERGREYTTREFAEWLQQRQQAGQDLTFLIGGADGFSAAVRERADHSCALSRMTMPHALARVVFIEQLYRAVLLLQGHPYHREGTRG